MAAISESQSPWIAAEGVDCADETSAARAAPKPRVTERGMRRRQFISKGARADAWRQKEDAGVVKARESTADATESRA